jgi:hypothetical protein
MATMLASQHPWVKSYFGGQRARAGSKAAAAMSRSP